MHILALELERKRSVSQQVLQHLTGNYGVERDAVGQFLVDKLPAVEDYEVDLILSPIFTPTLQDQAVIAEALGAQSIPQSDWPPLIQELVARPVHAQLATEDGLVHSVPLREVTVERYIRRLRLDGTIPGPLFDLIKHLAPAVDQPILKAVARRAVWELPARREILMRCLSRAADHEQYRLDDLLDLLKLVETYKPANTADLLGRIPHWRSVLRHEVSLARNPKPFFNERVQELHGGGRDQRQQDQARINDKERELTFLDRLENVLSESPRT